MAQEEKNIPRRGEYFLSDNVEVETDIELEVSSFLTWQARQTRRDVVGGS